MFDFRKAESLILEIIARSNATKAYTELLKLHKPNFQWESKAYDADGDLVTMTLDRNWLEYIRRSHAGDDDGRDDGVVHYLITSTPSGVRAENKFKPVTFWKKVVRNLVGIKK